MLPFELDGVTAGSSSLSRPRILNLFFLIGRPEPVKIVAPEEALLLWIDDLLAIDSGLDRDARDMLIRLLSGELLDAGRNIWEPLSRHERRVRPGEVVVSHLLILDQRYAQVGQSQTVDLHTGEMGERKRTPLRTLAYDLTALFVARRARMYQADPGQAHRQKPAEVTPKSSEHHG